MENEISEKLRLPTLLFALFLWPFGAHRFYVGKKGTGTLMLVISLTVVGMLITSIWALIDWISIASGTFTDGKGLKIIKWSN